MQVAWAAGPVDESCPGSKQLSPSCCQLSCPASHRTHSTKGELLVRKSMRGTCARFAEDEGSTLAAARMVSCSDQVVAPRHCKGVTVQGIQIHKM